jgi:hypothetical protein
VAAAPAFTKFANIAGFEADVYRAPPVANRDPVAPACDQLGKMCLFCHGKIGIVGIAKKVELEAFAVSRSIDALDHRLQVSDDADRQLVPNA